MTKETPCMKTEKTSGKWQKEMFPVSLLSYKKQWAFKSEKHQYPLWRSYLWIYKRCIQWKQADWTPYNKALGVWYSSWYRRKFSAYIPQKEIPDICIKAYEEFKNVPNAYQRDNIYYNINKSNNPGYLDRNIRDRIYRFRINANAYSKIAEQDKDPKLQNHTEHKRKLTVMK